MARHYDLTARLVIAAVARAAGLTTEAAAWGCSFAIGALVAVVARSGRTERLGARAGIADEEEVPARPVAFAAAGIRALGEASARRHGRHRPQDAGVPRTRGRTR